MGLSSGQMYGLGLGLVLFLVVILTGFWLLVYVADPTAARAARKRARRRRRVHKMKARAATRRADGSRGPRARRALRVLFRRTEFDALWRVWLAGPDDQVWRLLHADHRGWVFGVVTYPGHAEDVRSAVGAFCAARGLAPDGPTERALFFVLTGQRAQHRADDPDGSLLAEAYRKAHEEQRAAVRQALAGADDLDLVRVIAGAGRGAVAAVTPEEASYLAGQFAARADWAGLLQFALGLPLASAVTATSVLGEGWQPGDSAGRVLLQQLATADAQEITLAIADGDLTADGNTTAELLRRPLALLTPADLDTVASLLLTQPSRPLELLAACLQYRFGSEITLGMRVPLTPGSADDVAVSPGPAGKPHAQA
jgi:hypothetical protein